MAKKKNKGEDVIPEGLDMKDLIGQLMKGTNFEISEETNVLSQRIKVPTPIEAINCILGGGTPLGSICESFGGPRSGKSTWLYLTMAKFQEKYSDGLCLILDNESSADDSRLEFFGVDTSRVLRLPSSSIETGFLNLLQILKNKSKSEQARKMPVFVVWDSISKGMAQDNSTQSRMNAQDRARVIKNYMSEVLPQIEKHPFVLNLINQVVFETDMYGNKKVKSGGGVGLEHDVHFKVKTELARGDEHQGGLLVGRYSNISIVKSKFSPEFSNIPVYIDITQGGKIDEERSFVDYLVRLEIIPNNSGYYKVVDTLGAEWAHTQFLPVLNPIWGSKRYGVLIEEVKSNPTLYKFLRVALMERIGNVYSLQKEVMRDYKEELMAQVLEELNRFEYRLGNAEFMNEVLDAIQDNPGVVSKLETHLHSDDPRAICIKCGEVLDYHKPHKDCKDDFTLSKEALAKLLGEFYLRNNMVEDCTEEYECTEDNMIEECEYTEDDMIEE